MKDIELAEFLNSKYPKDRFHLACNKFDTFQQIKNTSANPSSSLIDLIGLTYGLGGSWLSYVIDRTVASEIGYKYLYSVSYVQTDPKEGMCKIGASNIEFFRVVFAKLVTDWETLYRLYDGIEIDLPNLVDKKCWFSRLPYRQMGWLWTGNVELILRAYRPQSDNVWILGSDWSPYGINLDTVISLPKPRKVLI